MRRLAPIFALSPAWIWLVGLLALLTPAQASAKTVIPSTENAEPAPKLRVGVSHFPPFSLTETGQPEGYSIGVWERIAAALEWKYEFVMCASAEDKLKRMRNGELDVAIGGLTVTPDREIFVDFTHPTYQSGLSVAIRAEDQGTKLWPIIKQVVLEIPVTLDFLALMLIAAHLIWLLERGRAAFSKSYLKGVFEGLYWSIVTASTVGYGDKVPLRWPGQALAMGIIILSLPLFALFTAHLSSAFTVAQIQDTRISSPDQLHGKTVGVVRGTTSANLLARIGLKLRHFDDLHQAYNGLMDHKVDNIVYDNPALQYLAKTEGEDKVIVLPGEFDRRSIAFALQEGSPLRELLNRELLRLRDTGVLNQLATEWMGP